MSDSYTEQEAAVLRAMTSVRATVRRGTEIPTVRLHPAPVVGVRAACEDLDDAAFDDALASLASRGVVQYDRKRSWVYIAQGEGRSRVQDDRSRRLMAIMDLYPRLRLTAIALFALSLPALAVTRGPLPSAVISILTLLAFAGIYSLFSRRFVPHRFIMEVALADAPWMHDEEVRVVREDVKGMMPDVLTETDAIILSQFIEPGELTRVDNLIRVSADDNSPLDLSETVRTRTLDQVEVVMHSVRQSKAAGSLLNNNSATLRAIELMSMGAIKMSADGRRRIGIEDSVEQVQARSFAGIFFYSSVTVMVAAAIDAYLDAPWTTLLILAGVVGSVFGSLKHYGTQKVETSGTIPLLDPKAR